MTAQSYKSALVLGLGASGMAAAELLLEEGAEAVVVDRRKSAELRTRAKALRSAGAKVEIGVGDLAHAFRRTKTEAGLSPSRFDVCVVSPGIAADSDWLHPVVECGIGVISELELGATRCRCPLLAATGSNGKSTFVKLCGLAMELNGYRAVLAGNYGVPLSAAVCGQGNVDWIVVEVSSFQLENVHSFAPDIAVLLNIEPDHLDRHGNMDAYVGLKARIFDRLSGENVAIVNDQALELMQKRTTGSPRWISFGSGPRANYRYDDGCIRFREDETERTLSLAGTLFCNEVTGLTAAAALATIRCAGMDSTGLAAAVRTYVPLRHRMQEVPNPGLLRFVDDSKATNMAAMSGALRMAGGPVRLIAGGLLKEREFERVKELLAKTAKSVYLIGQSAKTLEQAWGDTVQCHLCRDLRQAVRLAWRDADPGDVILLSPGCASFDQFRSFEDRGDRFQAIVRSLNEEV